MNLVGANRAVGDEGGHIEKIISEDGLRYIDVAYPIFGGKAGTLRIGLSEAPYRRQVRQLWLQMTGITLGILALALAASQWMIRRLTLPLRKLTQYAEQIGEGSLDTRIDVQGRQEVSKLASAFNSMLLRLQDYTQRLEATNAEGRFRWKTNRSTTKDRSTAPDSQPRGARKPSWLTRASTSMSACTASLVQGDARLSPHVPPQPGGALHAVGRGAHFSLLGVAGPGGRIPYA